MNKRISIIAIALIVQLVLHGCGKPSAVQETPAVKKEVLHVFFTGETAIEPVLAINERFENENPGIKIQYESSPTDQYEYLIKTRLSSGDAPDVFLIFPGTKKDPFVQLGYLEDLSDEPWVSGLMDGPRESVSYGGRVYAFPPSQGSIAVIYNRTVYRELGITVPASWSEFLAVCRKLKDAGYIPMALGNKESWFTQLLPYAMAPSAIYQANPGFDDDMKIGKTSFTGSVWESMMSDYVQLEKDGFFNKGYMETTYQQAIDLLAGGKAAMMVTGTWGIDPIRQSNPAIDLGMFPLPYTDREQRPWVSTGVAASLAVSSETNVSDAAKAYVKLWAVPEINERYLEQTNHLPTLKAVNPNLDSVTRELLPYLETGTYSFLDQNWPSGVQDKMFQGIRNVLLQKGTNEAITDMLRSMDQAYRSGLEQEKENSPPKKG